MLQRIALFALILFATTASLSAGLKSDPASRAQDVKKLSAVDAIIESAIAKGHVPGAVLLVGDRQGVLYRKAYGHRSLFPQETPMTVDTIFDMASITKSVATNTSIMLLIQQGKIDPQDKVAKYIPSYASEGKEDTTIEHLLLHWGGLPPVNSVKEYQGTRQESLENVFKLKPRFEPGTDYTYTCCGYIVLGDIVQRISGKPLDVFARENVFKPLGMKDTTYNPGEGLLGRCAPTEKRDGDWIVGQVHDPRAFALGGVSGNAGMFSTADDLAKYCQMVLHDGQLPGGKTFLTSEVLNMMSTPHVLPDGTGRRTYGFGVGDGFVHGEKHNMNMTSIVHTGYTGTKFAIDPFLDGYYILLTNRVHPDDTRKKELSELRNNVAEVVEQCFIDRKIEAAAAPFENKVINGIDVLQQQEYKPLHNKRVAIITNHTGVDIDGHRIVDLLVDHPKVNVTKIFSPEHGLYGTLDRKVDDTTDEKTNLKVYSLYGKTRTPTDEMLEDVDVIVFDIQDIGARYYTYPATMGNAMKAASAKGIEVMVLDRPNPITGTLIDGPIADDDKFGFTAFGALPIAHGMTVGELAKMFNKEYDINCKLTVIPCEGWKRDMWYDETGLTWINPSPNMRNLTQGLLYLVTGVSEASNVSVGRGTDQPFEYFGAPWIEGRRLAHAMNEADLPGLRFVPIAFTPDEREFTGEPCEGVYIIVTDRQAVEPVMSAMVLAWTLKDLYPTAFQIDKVNRLLKNDEVLNALKSTTDPTTIPALWKDDLAAFKKVRAKYLMYE